MASIGKGGGSGSVCRLSALSLPLLSPPLRAESVAEGAAARRRTASRVATPAIECATM